MRKIEQQMNRAVVNKINWSNSNTFVEYNSNTNCSTVVLHRTAIATYDHNTQALKLNTGVVTSSNLDNTPKPFYEDFRILSPAQDSAQWSGNGSLEISLETAPSLFRTHMVELYVDGELKDTGSQLTFTLTNIDRGTHTLKALIRNRAGNVLATQSHTFTLHRPSVNR